MRTIFSGKSASEFSTAISACCMVYIFCQNEDLLKISQQVTNFIVFYKNPYLGNL